MVSWPVTCNIRIYTVWRKPRRASEERAVLRTDIWTRNFVKGSSIANHITRDPGCRGCLSHAVSCVSACAFGSNSMPTCASRYMLHCLHVWVVLTFVNLQSLAAGCVSSLYCTKPATLVLWMSHCFLAWRWGSALLFWGQAAFRNFVLWMFTYTGWFRRNLQYFWKWKHVWF